METRYWLTTDTHFGHKRMLEYCERPQDFDGKIMKYLLANVKPEDVLIHLGDVCMGNDKYYNNWFKLNLQCKTWLIRGNHDMKSNTWYLLNGWDMICQRLYLRTQNKIIAFSHEPINDDGYYDYNIHGHIHNAVRDLEYEETKLNRVINNKQRLIALEYTNYQPLLLKTFIEKL